MRKPKIMCRERPHLPVRYRLGTEAIARNPRDLVLLRCSGKTLGLTVFLRVRQTLTTS